MNGATDTTQKILDCPACKHPVHAYFSLSVHIADGLNPGSGGSVDAHVSITGMQVEHDCTPKAKRSEATRVVDDFMNRRGSDAQ
ncbi:hypothetical protein ACRAJ3_11470 [Rhodococcus pyridinivorans]|uniref:hypothetical protein n=1 Tax=Rhodococcus pyridinivorans TaxID=103816 RepID=UPI003D7FF582